MPQALVRRSHTRNVARYAPLARAAGNLVSRAYKSYTGRNKSGSKRKSGSNGDDIAPLYGSTFTSKIQYRSRRPNKRRARRAKRSFRTFMKNSMKLQNAQNALSQGAFNIPTAADNQTFWSLDILNAGVVESMIRGQLPSAPNFTSLRDFNLHLKSFSLRYYLQNTGLGPMTLDIYHVQPRRNITFEELASGPGLPTVPTNGNVLAGWFNSVNQSATKDNLPDSIDGIPGFNTLGFSPFLHSNFCRMFKIGKIRTVVLPPGGTFEERDTVRMKQLNIAKLGLFNTQQFNVDHPTLSPRVNFLFRGLSRCILFRQRGMPSNTLNAGPTQIACAWEESMTSKVIQTKPGSSAFYTGAA